MAAQIEFMINGKAVSVEQARTLVTDQLMQFTVDSIASAANEKTANVYCPVHGDAPRITVHVLENGKMEIEMGACCSLFKKSATQALRAIKDTAYFDPHRKLVLTVPGAATPFTFDLKTLKRLNIGRAGNSEEPIHIDLTPYQALENGISRLHATILWVHGQLHVHDHNSVNGTYINDNRLEAGESRVLHGGDKLRFGQLTLDVILAESPQTQPFDAPPQ